MVRGDFMRGIVYLCIHKKLHERCGMSKIMEKKAFFRLIGETYHIPKPQRIIVLKEMEQMKMVVILGTRRNNNIKVLPLFADPEKDINKFYEQMGLF
jgi:hypothetical protein